jgi:hypothetical protein
MMRMLIILLMAVMVSGQAVAAQGEKTTTKKAVKKKAGAKKAKDDKVVQIGGMSIIGNRELPKSLYIVPWKDSDVDSETDLSRDLLNERAEVVDQDEFKRQLNYYDLSK